MKEKSELNNLINQYNLSNIRKEISKKCSYYLISI